MPTTYKVLGQTNPSATTLVTVYTVPSSTQSVVSSISVCNTSTTASTYRIAVRINGATIATGQYLAYDASIPGNDTAILTPGISLGAGDIISGYAGSANLAFGVYGAEIT
jgi:hypothetical protein